MKGILYRDSKGILRIKGTKPLILSLEEICHDKHISFVINEKVAAEGYCRCIYASLKWGVVPEVTQLFDFNYIPFDWTPYLNKEIEIYVRPQ